MRKLPAALMGISLVLVIAASSGCYYDNEETLYPNTGCDTTNVSFSANIKPIFENRCYSCHSNANAPISGNGVSWEGYSNDSSYLATSPDVFLASIKHDVGYTPMPSNQPKLSDCEIRQFEIWIAAGFPNN